jgi:hypothetical protein
MSEYKQEVNNTTSDFYLEVNMDSFNQIASQIKKGVK